MENKVRYTVPLYLYEKRLKRNSDVTALQLKKHCIEIYFSGWFFFCLHTQLEFPVQFILQNQFGAAA